jgi:hypothetical protein
MRAEENIFFPREKSLRRAKKKVAKLPARATTRAIISDK